MNTTSISPYDHRSFLRTTVTRLVCCPVRVYACTCVRTSVQQACKRACVVRTYLWAWTACSHRAHRMVHHQHLIAALQRGTQDPGTGMLPPLTPRARSPRSGRSTMRPMWKDARCVCPCAFAMHRHPRVVLLAVQLAANTPGNQPEIDGAAVGRLRNGLRADGQLSGCHEVGQRPDAAHFDVPSDIPRCPEP